MCHLIADVSAGIAVGLINDIPTCEALVARIGGEAEGIIGGLSGMISGGSSKNEDEAWERNKTRQSKL